MFVIYFNPKCVCASLLHLEIIIELSLHSIRLIILKHTDFDDGQEYSHYFKCLSLHKNNYAVMIILLFSFQFITSLGKFISHLRKGATNHASDHIL